MFSIVKKIFNKMLSYCFHRIFKHVISSNFIMVLITWVHETSTKYLSQPIQCIVDTFTYRESKASVIGDGIFYCCAIKNLSILFEKSLV